MIEVLLAVPDLPQEEELVTAAAARGLRIVRRCVDSVDLLAAAAAAPLAVSIVSAGLPRVSEDVVARIAAGREGRVVGLADHDAAAEQLRRLGLDAVARCGPTAAATAALLAEVLVRTAGPTDDRASGVWSTGLRPEAADANVDSRPGRVIAVWGAMGSPGRTTVAIGVAEALADAGRSVCLVDADTYAPGVTLALGMVDDAGGLLAACRQADHGSLGPESLTAASRLIRPGWHVLGGLPRPERWTELRATALDRVWVACREAFDVTVIDIGFCLEVDDSPGAWARRRNAASLTAVSTADHLLAVADAGPAGAARLISAWPLVGSGSGPASVTIVRNRARGDGRPWAAALREMGIRAPIRSVPADPKALAACWARGRTLGEGARRSRIRRALGEVAAGGVSG